MGKRSRRKRAEVKDLCRRLNYRENEFGELVPKMTKAEARRRFLRLEYLRRVTEKELIDACVKQAHDDICAIEDAEFVQHINQTLGRDILPPFCPQCGGHGVDSSPWCTSANVKDVSGNHGEKTE